ncbi:MAG: FKBP-type peptidyl-prolyl cis-trans isomerase [Sphingomonadaceae bacterium]|nr:FKBP-type peptidyl-prolyl cis-trans isomerase [Sphingomonadaceae bacterium]
MSEVTAVPIRPLAKGSMLKLWLGLILVCLAGAALAWVGTSSMQVTTTQSGLRYQVLAEGEGPNVTPADLVAVDYTGRANGNVFDSSESRGQPLITGTSGMIPGFGEALQLMRKGSRIRVWIPPRLAYNGQVPPGAPFGPNDTLEFDLHVREVAPGMAAAQQAQQMQQLQQQMEAAGHGGHGGAGGNASAGSEAGAAPGADAGAAGGDAASGAPSGAAPSRGRRH